MTFGERIWHHRRAILFLIAVLAIGGLFSAFQLPVSLFPHAQFPRVRVELSAGERPAKKMVLQVTRPMEVAIRSVPGVTGIHSTTTRGTTDIIVDFAWGDNIVSSMLQVQSAVSQTLSQVPPGTDFRIVRMEPSLYPVVAFSLTSKREGPVKLRDIGRYQLRPLLTRVKGVRRVGIQGGEIAEYRVSVKPTKLRALGLSFANVAKAVSASNVLNAVGRMQDHYKLYLAVSDTRFKNLNQIKQTVLKTGRDGEITLADVATIKPAYVPRFISVGANNQPAVLVNVFQQPGGNTVAIDQAVKAALAAYKSKLPKDVQVKKWYDQSTLVTESAGSVRDAMIIGVITAALVLLIFLKSLKISFLAIIAVPIVLAVTILALKVFHSGFNIMTLGGMSAAIGLIIDDMVVIVEHLIRRFREKPDYNAQTILAAAREFTHPLAGSSASTIIIFFPLAFLGGVTGAFFKALSLTMASALVISFFVAWLAVPIVAARWLGPKDAAKEDRGRFSERINNAYTRMMRRLLRRPVLLAIGLVPLIVLGYISFHQVGTGFLPKMDEGGFVLDFRSPPGTSLKETDRLLAEVGRIIDHNPAVATYSVRAGTQLGGGITEANRGDFFIQLKSFPRPPIFQVMDTIRQEVTMRVPSLDIETSQLMEDIIGDLTSVPQPVDIKLFGNNDRQLLRTGPKVAQAIKRVRGIVGVKSGVVIAGAAINVQVDRVRAAMEGVTPGAVTQQLRAYLAGLVTTQVQSGIKFIGVRVWVPRKMRTTTEEIGQFRIRAADGHEFPLDRIASVHIVTGQPQIVRQDLKRMVPVTARISGRDLGSTIAAVKQVLKKPGLIPPHVSYTLGGLYQQQQIAFHGLTVVYFTALILVFVLLLFLYERFRVAISIIIMPLLATLAVFFGLWITGIQLNITAIMGMTLIVGIVTEVAIFYFSELYEIEASMTFRDAIIQAGINRMRPIGLTTLAFILALLPLAFNIGSGAAMLQPLAVAIIAGLIAQMPLVLIVMPVVYYVFARRLS